MSKERPILFSGPMVRAILEGRKTQTRRVIKPQPPDKGCVYKDGLFMVPGASFGVARNCPYGQPGDRLWVRETHYLWGRWEFVTEGKGGSNVGHWQFLANGTKGIKFPDNPPLTGCKGKEGVGWYKRPAIFMPRWACRIVLEATAVRVERVQDLCEASQVWEEGIKKPDWWSNMDKWISPDDTAVEMFAELWDSINGKTYPWASNPFVWVVEFKKVEK